MRDDFKIGAEFSRITEGIANPSPWFATIADAVAAIKVLAEAAPDGWDIEKMDPLAPDSYQRIMDVFNALRDKETFFREGAGKGSEAPGARDGRDGGAVVPKDVPPATKR